MKAADSKCLFLLLTSVSALCACTHTPAGTSVEIALAKRAEVIKVPPALSPVTPPSAKLHASATKSPSGGIMGNDLPMEKTEQVADAFSRGKFCMEGGKDEEAIAAFQEVVKLDPSFGDAWNHLAALYEKTGQDKMALIAFKKSKYAQQ